MAANKFTGTGPHRRWANRSGYAPDPRWGRTNFGLAELGRVVMVMMVVMVMGRRGERRSGKHQDQKHSSKDLLHGVNVTRGELWKPA